MLRKVLLITCVAAATTLQAAEVVSIEADPKTGFRSFFIAGAPFTPIGVNYLEPHVGGPYKSFGMFDKGVFDPQRIDHEFAAISANGFNFVRLWLKGIDPDRGFDVAGESIGEVYVDNVVTALTTAARHKLRVVLTGAFRNGVWLPKNYLPRGPMPGEHQIGDGNRLLLIPEMADSLGRFYRDLLMDIKKRDARALDALFYVDGYNELQFDLSQPPFSSAGKFDFLGETYDLADMSMRQNLMDRAARLWFSKVSAQVKSVDPRILVTASSFHNTDFGHTGFDGGRRNAAAAGPSPYPLRPSAILAGGADLIDIHTYPSVGRPGLPPVHDRIASMLASNEIDASTARRTPIVIGEFGAAKGKFPKLDDAPPELTATLAALCKFHVSGYAFWMWNGVGDTWTLQDEVLMQAVHPKDHPSFCGNLVEQR